MIDLQNPGRWLPLMALVCLIRPMTASEHADVAAATVPDHGIERAATPGKPEEFDPAVKTNN